MIPYEDVCSLAQEAGLRIMDIYKSKDFDVEEKEDGSPVTRADLSANDLIVSTLKKISPHIPILSEESYTEHKDILSLDRFWIVDPLDGTKDFIGGTGDFTVNIALIESGVSVAGFIYVPVTEELFYSWEGTAYKNGQILKTSKKNNPPVAGVSNFHKSDKLSAFLKKNNIHQVKAVGSSLKFCRLAEGLLDIYARLGPTSQWDTAAGQAILEAARCKMLTLDGQKRVFYGDRDIINPSFVAHKPDLSWHL